MSASVSRRLPPAAWALGYLLLVTTGLSWVFAAWSYDDPFITYRYADNLSRGLGMVYNPGERLLSTTTPLFTLLLSLLRPLSPDLHRLAVLIGAFSLGLGGLFLWQLTSLPGLRFTRWAGLLFYPLFPLAASTLSSETPLYLACCLGAFAFYRRRQMHLTAVCAALAALTRPDGFLVALVIGLLYLSSHLPRLRQWRQWLSGLPWLAALIYLSITGTWVIFAWLYYGSPVPLTLYAKQQQAAVTGSTAFLPGFLTILSWYSAWPQWVQAALALPGMVYGMVRFPSLRGLFLWSGLYFIAYSLLSVTRYFWYYAPLVPLFVVGFGLGLDACREVARGYLEGKATTEVVTTRRRFDLLFTLLVGVVIGTLLVGQTGRLWRMSQSPDSRLPIYQAAGLWLREHTQSEAAVGSFEVGIIGYYARRPMVDFAGLIQPEIAVQLGQTGSYLSAARWAMQHYQPNYLVVMPGAIPEQEIASQCAIQVTFPGADYGYASDLRIYACP